MLANDLFPRIGYTDAMISEYHKCKTILGDRFEPLARDLMSGALPFTEAGEAIHRLAPDLPPETADLMFLLECTGYLLEGYRSAGLPDEMFYNAMMDIRCKTAECMAVRGVFGTFVIHWYPGFFAMTRFAFGRLQFDVTHHSKEPRTLCGHTIAPGDLVLQCHIPSLGPLPHEACLDSYRRAYAFFREELKDGLLVIRCGSWMLMPDYQPMLRECAPNIYRFAQDFALFKRNEAEEFRDGWRIFNKEVVGRDVSGLPDDTRLRRGFLRHIATGGAFGSGDGYLLFDGKNILTESGII